MTTTGRGLPEEPAHPNAPQPAEASAHVDPSASVEALRVHRHARDRGSARFARLARVARSARLGRLRIPASFRSLPAYKILVGAASFAGLAFLGLFLILPVIEILQASAARGSILEAFSRVLGTGDYAGRTLYRDRLLFSAKQATWSTLLTLAAALPAAYLFANHRFPGKSDLKAILTVPFVLPPIVVALAFLALVGSGGLLDRALVAAGLPPAGITRGLGLILAAHVFYNYAIVLRVVGSAWSHLDVRLEEAAATLGAGPLRRFLRVTLPLLAPSIAAAALLVFLFTFTSMGIVLILGNGLQHYTLDAMIYFTAVRRFDLPLAAALALTQLLLTLLLATAYIAITRRADHRLTPAPAAARERPLTRAALPLLLVNGLVAGLLVLAPLLALAEGALRTSSAGGASFGSDAGNAAYSFANFAMLASLQAGDAFYTAPAQAAWNSIRIALATTVIALPLGAIVARFALKRRRAGGIADALAMAPLGLSSATLGLGLLLLFPLLLPPTSLVPPGSMAAGLLDGFRLSFDWRGHAILLAIAHALVAYPFVTRILAANARVLDPRFGEAAAALGAGPFARFRRVTLPLLAPGLLVAAVFAFAISMGEFGATLLLQRADQATLPVLLYQSLTRPGVGAGPAFAGAALLCLVTIAAFIVIERFRYKDVGEF